MREAYAAGAGFVDVRWDDDDVQLARFQLAPGGTFDQISKWRVDAEIETAEAGGAVIAIRATNPNLLGNVDQNRVATHQRAWATYRSSPGSASIRPPAASPAAKRPRWRGSITRSVRNQTMGVKTITTPTMKNQLPAMLTE